MTLSDYAMIEDNEIYANVDDGVELNTCESFTISQNNVYSNGNNGINIQNCLNGVIDGNYVDGNWDGVHLEGSSDITIENNTISNNSEDGVSIDSNMVSVFQNDIYGNAWGVWLWGTADDVYVNFNRIVDNTVDLGYEASGDVDATLNWWGYNDAVDVDSHISNTGSGILVYDPWIVLSITANPTSVGTGGSSIITADLLHDSDGVYHDPVDGVVPYTGSANFTTTMGTVADVNFANGKATSTLNGLTTPGTAVVSSTVDYQTVYTEVVVYPVATIPEIIGGAAYVKAFYELNHMLPANVVLGTQSVTMSQFLYLLVTATRNINNGIMTPITIIAVNPPTAPSGTYTTGNLYKAAYLTVANNIKNFVITNGRAPNWAQTTLGKIPFTKLVYMYSKIINFYGTNLRLPNYVTI
jgi:parallel beta-helix repeat protein